MTQFVVNILNTSFWSYYGKESTLFIVQRSTCVGSAWSFGFFHSRHNGQWPPTSKDFLSQILSIICIVLS